MSTSTTSPDRALGAGRGRGADVAFRVLVLGAGVLMMANLALIAVSTLHEAWPAFRHEGFRFVASNHWVEGENRFGALAFVYGTAVVSTIAVLLAVPVSVGIALFATEVAPRRLGVVVNAVMDLLAGVPSVVFGLWGVLVLAPAIGPLYGHISSALHPVPGLHQLFNGSSGRSFFTAGMIVALMITPIITSVTREVLKTVPRNDKDGALALGATRWEMIRGVVFPHSIGGIVGATMLGLGRAMGETIAVALVIGSTPQIVANVFSGGDAMPAVIVNQFGQAEGLQRAALIGLGVALFAMTIVVNAAARIVVTRVEVRLRGAA